MELSGYAEIEPHMVESFKSPRIYFIYCTVCEEIGAQWEGYGLPKDWQERHRHDGETEEKEVLDLTE